MIIIILCIFCYNHFQVTAFDNLGRPPSNSQSVSVNLLVLNDFQRVRIIFNIDIDTILAKEEFIIE